MGASGTVNRSPSASREKGSSRGRASSGLKRRRRVGLAADGAQSSDPYEGLFTRLWRRGLEELGLIVADGAAAIESARVLVYTEAGFQLRLWRWWRALRRRVPGSLRRRFSRDFWEVYEGLDRAEVIARARRFRRRWREISRPVVSDFNGRSPARRR